MYSSDEDDDDARIDDLWTYKSPEIEEVSEEQKKEELLATKKTRKRLESM